MTALLRQRDGHLTRDLLRAPGGFGLGQVPARLKPDATADLVCGYCSTGCSLTVHLKDGKPVGLTPAHDYPVNRGVACPKGWEALAVLEAPDRAKTPLQRDASGVRRPVSWDAALRTMVERFKAIQTQHGPEAVAFLSTGQMPTEEMALLGALAKFGMGMAHGDGNTRQCMATSVVAYKQAFGFDAPPYTYRDFEQSDVIVLVGANLCLAHPIMWERVLRNPHRPDIVVIDPRVTETAMQATQHLPLRPKSDQSLFYGLAHLFVERGWIDRGYVEAHTHGFEEFAAAVAPFTIHRTSAETGLPPADIERLAATIHAGRRVSFWWTMGVNQSYQGVRTAQSIINLALITGNIGRPGTGANSITGQCNAMGSRLFSNTTNLLGGRDFENADHRATVARTLGLDPDLIPRRNSWAYNRIIEGILREQIKGLWVVATNTAHSWINQGQARDILGRLDCLVVQDMYASTETAQMADLVLPAAAWGEKDGTFINSERRIGTIRKVARPPGQALPDFAIFKLVAEYWGCGSMFRAWESPAAAFQILKRLSAGQPCDITGIAGYDMLEEQGGIQWPCADGDAPPAARSERRLFEDGRYWHADGRARLLFETPHPLPEPPTDRFPLILLTGRGSAAQWHTQTRTSKSAVLRKLYPARIYVEVNPADARERGIGTNDSVHVESRRGRIAVTAFVTRSVQPGHLFIPMHYADTNRLTDAVFDPYSKQPSYKACAVQLHPAI
ncbi:MAG: nitrate reductase [Acidobacteria bacterium]|nr:nitrate reductase [Acidobacteriota bacterium]